MQTYNLKTCTGGSPIAAKYKLQMTFEQLLTYDNTMKNMGIFGNGALNGVTMPNFDKIIDDYVNTEFYNEPINNDKISYNNDFNIINDDEIQLLVNALL